MRPTVWLTSYPKSGNTWFRALLSNLDPARAEPAAINALDSTDSIASSRGRFDNHMLIESGLLTFDEIDDLRPALYRYLAADSYEGPFDPETLYPVRFVKTHDGYTHTRHGEPIMGGAAAAAGALLFVRDPRDVAASLANYQNFTIDEAIAMMADPSFCFCAHPRVLTNQLRQRLLGWGGYAASWLDQRDVPVHLVRYEEMHAAPLPTLRAALCFAGWSIDDATIERAFAFAAIDELQRQEADTGFGEAPQTEHGKTRFFRRGVAGGWRDELTRAQVKRIEQDHAAMMERLGYAPAIKEDFEHVDQQAG
ncbi:sulfotransferase domain-containing protein [Sphingomonas psychrolutea]|uniref:Sulfotransferase n=1 Tax=Sphingomonas psychrolutea TaxID=1259676 RepID=A0ABQ1H1U0_9SPHN|nr:sulfotransferase domain-containing protein [Sphingomonas psychrolutea]GGA55907.1 sulfotransferase [Sphingomonas psychrolutea]